MRSLEYCFNCAKKLGEDKLLSKPSRTFTSPNHAQWYEAFCSKDCRDKYNLERYVWLAEIDQNASDSECFEHDHWETDSMHRRIRVGRCNITGKKVEVEPNQPGDNSGQPIECYEHFKLRHNYVQSR